MGFTVTQIQPTPNPNAAKFLLDRAISPHPISFLTPEQGRENPIASQLFSIEGVSGLLLLGDFVTVNKLPQAKWSEINPRVREILQNLSDRGRF